MPNGILAKTVIPKNLERGIFSKRPYLMACKCPACAAIFLIKFKNKYAYKMTGMYATDCPNCKRHCDWINYEIFKFQYKWVRFWRGITKKGE